MNRRTAITVVVVAIVLALTGIDITLIATGHVQEALNVLSGAAVLIGFLAFIVFLGSM